MTQKEYSVIQRELGYIIGLISHTDTIVCDGVISAIQIIDEIIDKEMVGEDE